MSILLDDMISTEEYSVLSTIDFDTMLSQEQLFAPSTAPVTSTTCGLSTSVYTKDVPMNGLDECNNTVSTLPVCVADELLDDSFETSQVACPNAVLSVGQQQTVQSYQQQSNVSFPAPTSRILPPLVTFPTQSSLPSSLQQQQQRLQVTTTTVAESAVSFDKYVVVATTGSDIGYNCQSPPRPDQTVPSPTTGPPSYSSTSSVGLPGLVPTYQTTTFDSISPAATTTVCSLPPTISPSTSRQQQPQMTANAGGVTAGVKRGRPKLSTDETLDGPSAEKKERRRKQNREAATRCRQKRRQEYDELKKNHDTLIQTHQSLKEQFQQVQCELRRVMQTLNDHVHTCGFKIPES